MILEKYKTFIFDCDGVILDSNKVKTDAFYRTALPYGEAAAQALVDYHLARGGVSRYRKFEWFLTECVPGRAGPDLAELLGTYAAEVRDGLLKCEIVGGLRALRERTRAARWLIVSGGDQSELREIFGLRGLTDLFDGGVFGSPDAKPEIIRREVQGSNIVEPAVFVGDSAFDHACAVAAGFDFVFVSEWSELAAWPEFCEARGIRVLRRVSDLLTCS